MTVQELIDLLNKLDKDTPIFCGCFGNEIDINTIEDTEIDANYYSIVGIENY